MYPWYFKFDLNLQEVKQNSSDNNSTGGGGGRGAVSRLDRKENFLIGNNVGFSFSPS